MKLKKKKKRERQNSQFFSIKKLFTPPETQANNILTFFL